MIRTVYTPNSNIITLPIPDRYIGAELEISIFPLVEIHTKKEENNKSNLPDLSFGAWADMEKSDKEICAEIRSSRHFRKREVAL